MTAANSHEAKAALRFYDGHNRHAGARKQHKQAEWRRRRRRGRRRLDALR